jgi:hypothetical protein
MNVFKNNKKLKIIFITLLIILIGICIFSYVFYKKSQHSRFANVKELIESYQCTYIREEKSSDSNFKEDIYMTFRVAPVYQYGSQVLSSQEFYEGVIYGIGQQIGYSCRVIDEEHNVRINIYYGIGDTEITYLINDEQNYFKTELAKMQNNSNEFKIVDLTINAAEVNNLINSNWIRRAAIPANKDYTVNKYDYYNGGFKIRTLGTEVYNIVFTKNYKNQVVNGLTTNMTNDDVKKVLGEPTFDNKDTFNNVIGYKSQNIYAFFSEGQISIYPIKTMDETQTNKIIELFSKLNEDGKAATFYNDLIMAFPNPDESTETTEYVYAKYSVYGFEIVFGNYLDNGITIYNNFSGKLTNDISITELKNGNIPANVFSRLDYDAIFESEKSRALDEKSFRKGLNNSFEESTDFPLTNKYSLNYSESDSIVYFYSKDGVLRDSEMIYKDGMNFKAYNDTTFIYGIPKEGIYIYYADSAQSKLLINEEGNNKINSIEGNKVIYDDTKSIVIN